MTEQSLEEPKSHDARHISGAGIALIKRFERLSLAAYRCPAGQWTIGYGHTKGVKAGQSISEEQAEDLLREDLRESESAVESLVSVSLNEGEFAALVSFVFNLGKTALAKSALLRELNHGNRIDAASEFSRWIRAGTQKKILRGLVIRRRLERLLFIGAES